MREIKFRVFNKANSVMFYSDNSLASFLEDVNYLKKYKMEFELMQYTGLKDKNGKEIYEGDIVKSENYHYTSKCLKCGYEEHRDLIGKIVWVNEIIDENYYRQVAEFQVEDTDYDYISFEYLNFECMVEIIGNIYENPELLEVK